MKPFNESVNSPLLLQIALDMTSIGEAFGVAEKIAPWVDRIEVGTPLLISGGLALLRKFRTLYPSFTLIADTKICDAGLRIADAAFRAGASVVTVVSAAADRVTWAGAAEAAGLHGGNLMADLIGCTDTEAAAREAVDRGAHEVCLHLPKRHPSVAEDFEASVRVFRRVCESVSVPVYLAGGLKPGDLETVSGLGAKGLIVGGSITGSSDPAASAREFKEGGPGAQ